MIKDSTPSNDGFYMPAEFEPHEATIMVFPERPGSWPHGAKPAQKVFAQIIKEIAASEKVYVAVNDRTLKSAKTLLPEAVIADGELLSEAVTADGELPDRTIAGNKCGGKLNGNIVLLNIPTDDAWARDIAPTFVRSRDGRSVRGISWRFNAWGGEYDGLYAHWEKDDAFAAEFMRKTGYEGYDAGDFVLEGGSIHSNGAGTIMTTEACLLSPGRNPQLSKPEIEDRLKAYLGAERVIWLPRGIYNDETNEHVDNVCAFIDKDEAVLAWTDDKDDPQYEMSAACLKVLEDAGIKVHKLPIPDVPVTVSEDDLKGYVFEEGEDVREPGERLAASYVNFYFTNDAVLLPQFGGDNAESDARAVVIMKELCPGRRIVRIPARDIILGGGNIHCITQQIPARMTRESSC